MGFQNLHKNKVTKMSNANVLVWLKKVCLSKTCFNNTMFKPFIVDKNIPLKQCFKAPLLIT